MEKTKRNSLLTRLLAFVVMFGLCLGFGLNGSLVQTVYATGGEPNRAVKISEISIGGVTPNSTEGVTFANGVLTIESTFSGGYTEDDALYINVNITNGDKADLKVVINGGRRYVGIANEHGNLTIECHATVHAKELYAAENLTINGEGIFNIFPSSGGYFMVSKAERYSVAYAGEKISIEGKVVVQGSTDSYNTIQSVLCAKSIEINTRNKVQLSAALNTYGRYCAPVVFHSCGNANDLAGRLVIKKGALCLGKYYNTEDTQYNDKYGFVGYNDSQTGNIYSSSFDTENKAFTGYEIAESNKNLFVKARRVDFEQNGGQGDFVGYGYFLVNQEVTLPECPYTAPEGKHFAGWALGSKTATPLKQPGDTFTVEDNEFNYTSDYYGNYYNIYAIWEDNIPGLTGTVTVTGTLKFGETLTASVTETNNTGTLGYQWQRNGEDIEDATNSTYTLTAEDVGKTIKVVVTSSVETGSIYYQTTANIDKADGGVAPTGINATACTTADNNDGSITGVTTAMEYSADLVNWTDVAGTTITGLNNGTYYVRVKETATHKSSAPAPVTVNAYNAPVQYTITVNNGTANTVSATAGTTITLTANAPEEVYEFDKWTGVGVTFSDANSATTTFVMPAGDVTVTATYKLIPVITEPEIEPKPEVIETEPEKGLSAGAVVAIVVISLAVLGGGGFCVYYFVIRKKKLAK